MPLAVGTSLAVRRHACQSRRTWCVGLRQPMRNREIIPDFSAFLGGGEGAPYGRLWAQSGHCVARGDMVASQRLREEYPFLAFVRPILFDHFALANFTFRK